MISYFYLDSNFLIYLCQTVEKPTNHMIKCKFIAEETFIKVKKDRKNLWHRLQKDVPVKPILTHNQQASFPVTLPTDTI